MIVYVIPGKSKSLTDKLDHICDEMKIVKEFVESGSKFEENCDNVSSMTYEEFRASCIEGINRSLNYISSERRISGYVSGYLCNPDLAEEQFAITKEINLRRVGKILEEDNGNYFYHIIQSFPDGLEISYDEIHSCGVELVQRLELYQAVIATHFHTWVDEYGDLHGKQKCNHIIMNSHIYHEFVNKDNLEKMKYQSCKASYVQLQRINDQIAIEHGLPLVGGTVIDKSCSCSALSESNKGDG